ncbi:hypothetical protein GCM10023328_14110 [Modestobacter marinus]|uniref:Chromosome segregation ATPase n=1 Tax=Modestobacter marinus TaxID=477641 RepID=A0A846LR67_9ACTN|nr:hypothetical protein [Modestobacter marinus]NIH68954.1 chromosome segregation ATPase [Modestobacter marinus]GGL78669.1 hypothetical protein GCM10011589_38450 [Modestobacter marinus]
MARSVHLPAVRLRGRHRPNLSGDLRDLVSEAPPAFRRRLTGYDRLQVENYVVWAESELELAGRELDEFTRRLGRCTAQLDQAERRLATSPAGWELGRVSERVGEILRLAADEAADLVEAGVAEGERFREQGREAAAAALRQVQDVRARAVADCDRLHELARNARRTAEEELQLALAQAAALLHLAAAEHAAAAAEHAAAVAEAAEAHRVAEQEQAAAHTELARAGACRAQAEQVVSRLSGELDKALGELVPAPRALSVVAAVAPDVPPVGSVDQRPAQEQAAAS